LGVVELERAIRAVQPTTELDKVLGCAWSSGSLHGRLGLLLTATD
jgi:hypothetical protein